MAKGTEFSVDTNVKVTNYKPVEGREAKKSDINITNDSKNNVKVPKEYKPLFEAVEMLDGKKGLSWSDGLLAKSIAGQYDVNSVRLDPNAQVATFVFNDSSILRIDMGINNNTTIEKLQAEIASGNAEYSGGIINYLFQCFTSHTYKMGDEIVLNEIPDDCETLGDIKAKYKLPDGCLRNNVAIGGGNYDDRIAIAPIYIHVETLAKGIGATPDQIKSLFNQQ